MNLMKFIPLLALFLSLNAAKVELIDCLVLPPGVPNAITHPSVKLLIYFLSSALLCLMLIRFKSVIPLLMAYGIQTAYLFIHLAYILYFDVPFHLRQLVLDFYEGLLTARHFAIPLNLKYLFIILDLPLLILLVSNYSIINRLVLAFKRTGDLILILLAASLVCFVPFFFLNYKFAESYKNPFRSEMVVISKLGLLGNDISDFFVEHKEKAILNRFDYGNREIVPQKIHAQMQNIICIQVESLDANIIDMQYNGRYITPFLHQLSNECVFYPFMTNYRYAGASGDTDFTVLNGVTPAVDWPSYKLRNYTYPNSILKDFLRAGFNTVAFHNNDGFFFNRKTAFFNMGFQDFIDRIDMSLPEVKWGAPDDGMMNYVKEKLGKQKEPFFYYIITMSSHEPFDIVPAYYSNPFYNEIKNKEIRDYFISLSYVDIVLNDFIVFVKNHLKNTYIFIYGDHNAYTLYDPLSFQNRGVPLFIITPDSKRYRENAAMASMLDLAPTILCAAKISFDERVKGVNLLDFPIKDGLIPVNEIEMSSRRDLFNKDLKSQSRMTFNEVMDSVNR